jgi:hypothetical protein
MAYTLQAKGKAKAYGGVFSILRTPAFSSHMQYTVRYQAKVSFRGSVWDPLKIVILVEN